MILLLSLFSSLLVLALLFVSLYALPIRLELTYQRQSDAEMAQIRVALAAYAQFVYQLLPAHERSPTPVSSPATQPPGGLPSILLHGVRTALRLERAWRRSIRRLARHARFSTIEWQTTVGLGDAACTGLATGYLWAVKGCFIGKWQQQLTRTVPRLVVKVSPDFHSPKSQTYFHCIVELRGGHIIRAVGPLLAEFIENRGEL